MQQALGAVLLGLAILAIAAIVAFGIVRDVHARRRERAAQRAFAARYREAGFLSETSEATTGGNVARAAIVLINIAGVLAFTMESSAVRQAALAALLGAINVALGVGVVVGRRSIFVLRERGQDRNDDER